MYIQLLTPLSCLLVTGLGMYIPLTVRFDYLALSARREEVVVTYLVIHVISS